MTNYSAALNELLMISNWCVPSDEQGSPDLKAGKEVADYLGTVHHEFHFTVQVLIQNYCFKLNNLTLCE